MSVSRDRDSRGVTNAERDRDRDRGALKTHTHTVARVACALCVNLLLLHIYLEDFVKSGFHIQTLHETYTLTRTATYILRNLLA